MLSYKDIGWPNSSRNKEKETGWPSSSRNKETEIGKPCISKNKETETGWLSSRNKDIKISWHQ